MTDQIMVYTTPTCPWCMKVKDYLKTKGVGYNELNVAADYQAAKKMVETTGQRGVPVTMKGEQFVVGYDLDGLNELIGQG